MKYVFSARDFGQLSAAAAFIHTHEGNLQDRHVKARSNSVYGEDGNISFMLNRDTTGRAILEVFVNGESLFGVDVCEKNVVASNATAASPIKA